MVSVPITKSTCALHVLAQAFRETDTMKHQVSTETIFRAVRMLCLSWQGAWCLITGSKGDCPDADARVPHHSAGFMPSSETRAQKSTHAWLRKIVMHSQVSQVYMKETYNLPTKSSIALATSSGASNRIRCPASGTITRRDSGISRCRR